MIVDRKNFKNLYPICMFYVLYCRERKGKLMLTIYLNLIDNDNDRSLFERIYYSHRKQMLTVALSILKNEDDAEDLVHDVFCNIAEKHIQTLQNIKSEQDMKNYLLKATKNSALNMKRDTKRLILLNESETVFSKENLDDDKFFDMICGNLSYQEIISAIKSLDKKYEEVLYLHFVIEMTVPEVAEILSRNKQTVKKQISRGKALLLEKLSIYGGAIV